MQLYSFLQGEELDLGYHSSIKSNILTNMQSSSSSSSWNLLGLRHFLAVARFPTSSINLSSYVLLTGASPFGAPTASTFCGMADSISF